MSIAMHGLRSALQFARYVETLARVPGTPQTANLPAGTIAPSIGIYVVSHYEPPHAQPHEVLIPEFMTLPRCRLCNGVRFSLKSAVPVRIQDHDFFG
jgi:hypothetical protein